MQDKYKQGRRAGSETNFSGQHLLHNKMLLKEIVELAAINSNDTVLELGAGKGALTLPLAGKAGKVLAVEYDSKLIKKLAEKTKSQPNVKIIHQDILQVHLPRGPFRVVSNIPYAITTPIMKLLLKPASGMQRGILMVEHGAAKRFTAGFTKDPYIMAWKMWYQLSYVKWVSRNNFSPPPKVDSAVLKIQPKSKPLLKNKDQRAFSALVEYGLRYPHAPFYQVMRGIFTGPQIKHLRKNIGVENETPVGYLRETQWANVFQTMAQYVPRHRWPQKKR